MMCPITKSLVLAIILVGVTPSHAQPLKIEVKSEIYDWAVQESTGRIFASASTQNQIIEFDRSGGEVRRFDAPGRPTELIIKGRWLVAAMGQAARVWVLDLTSNTVRKPIVLSGGITGNLCCSKVDNSFIYVMTSEDTLWNRMELFQIDLETGKTRPADRMANHRLSSTRHMTMSADGRWALTDARGKSHPSGAHRIIVDEQQMTFREIDNSHQSYDQITAGPNGRYWQLGGSRYSLDRSRRVASYSGSPVAIHPYLDLVVGLVSSDKVMRKKSSLHMMTFDGSKSIGKVQLGDFTTLEKPDERNRRKVAPERTDDPTLQFIPDGGLLFCGYGSTAYIVRLDPFEIKSRLEIVAPSRSVAHVGQMSSIALQPSHPDLKGKVVFKVEKQVPGLELSDSKLTWTPELAQVGEHILHVTATVNGMTDTFTLPIDVTLPSIDVGLEIAGLSGDIESNRVVVWGRSTSHRLATNNSQPLQHYQGPMEYRVFDLKTSAMIAQGRSVRAYRTLALDAEAVYLSPKTGSILERVQLDGKEKEKVFLDASPEVILPLPTGKLLVFQGSSPQYFARIYDAKTLKLLPDHALNSKSPMTFPYGVRSQFYRGADYLVVGGRVLNVETGAVRCLLSSGPILALPGLTTKNSPQLSSHRSTTNQNPFFWGRSLDVNRLSNSRGTVLGQITHPSVGTISPYQPILISTRAVQERETVSLFFEIRDLVQGTLRKSAQLATQARLTRTHTNQSLTHFIGERVLIADHDRLFVASIPQSMIDEFPVPIHFSFPTTVSFSTTKPAEIHLKSNGGKGKKSFALLSEYQGITINESTGVVRLDVPGMWKRFLTDLPKTWANYRTKESLQKFRSHNHQVHLEQLGIKSVGENVAFALPISVAVRDESGDQDSLGFQVIALAPKSEFDGIVEAQEKAFLLAREQAEKRRREAMVQQAKAESERAAANRKKQVEPEGERVDQLDKRIKRLEALIDLLLEKVEKLEKKDN